ncbi:MAG TPA: hypothetical protein VKX49_16115 [Bryobacteraceae bacterium]|nr:hypothetical protein [Bryobacteraceae bacterium]
MPSSFRWNGKNGGSSFLLSSPMFIAMQKPVSPIVTADTLREASRDHLARV